MKTVRFHYQGQVAQGKVVEETCGHITINVQTPALSIPNVCFVRNGAREFYVQRPYTRVSHIGGRGTGEVIIY